MNRPTTWATPERHPAQITRPCRSTRPWSCGNPLCWTAGPSSVVVGHRYGWVTRQQNQQERDVMCCKGRNGCRGTSTTFSRGCSSCLRLSSLSSSCLSFSKWCSGRWSAVCSRCTTCFMSWNSAACSPASAAGDGTKKGGWGWESDLSRAERERPLLCKCEHGSTETDHDRWEMCRTLFRSADIINRIIDDELEVFVQKGVYQRGVCYRLSVCQKRTTAQDFYCNHKTFYSHRSACLTGHPNRLKKKKENNVYSKHITLHTNHESLPTGIRRSQGEIEKASRKKAVN